MPQSFKWLLEEIAAERAPGPSPTLTVFHLLLTLEFVAEKPVGRGALARNLGVGEGSARTIIDRLRDSGLVTISRAGCTLTRKGSNVWKESLSTLRKVEIQKSELSREDYNSAVLIRGQESRLKSGIDQRDAAIRIGAKNATTMVFRRGRLIIPSVSNDVAKDFPNAAGQILELLKPCEKDVVVIVGADTREKAEYGALAAAWTLLDDR